MITDERRKELSEMRRELGKRIKEKEKEKQLCWECELANGSGDCPWANNLQPVPGWTAIKYQRYCQTKTSDKTLEEGYYITACPIFIRDSCDGGNKWI